VEKSEEIEGPSALTGEDYSFAGDFYSGSFSSVLSGDTGFFFLFFVSGESADPGLCKSSSEYSYSSSSEMPSSSFYFSICSLAYDAARTSFSLAAFFIPSNQDIFI